MGNHEVKYFQVGAQGRYKATCACRWESNLWLNRQPVEDEVIRHQAHIEKVRAYLNTSTPSLKHTRDYYRLMAGSNETPIKDRPLWRQLAAELDHRLNDGNHEPHAQFEFSTEPENQ